MRIYSYVLYSRGIEPCEFREEIVENAEPAAEGWIVTKGPWDTTRYYREPRYVADMYALSASVASETPIENAKSLLATFMDKKASDAVYEYVRGMQLRLEQIKKCR